MVPSYTWTCGRPRLGGVTRAAAFTVCALSTLASCTSSSTPTVIRHAAADPVVAAPHQPIAGLTDAIRALVDSGQPSVLTATTPGDRKQLVRVYEAQAFAPLWIDATGRPGRDAQDALLLLGGAANDGLDPADYHAEALDRLASSLETGPGRPVSELATFDAGLTANVLRYLRELHSGRIDPRAVGFRVTTPTDHQDVAALLQTALANHRMADAASSLAPSLPLYRALRTTLAQYRSLAANPALRTPAASATPVRPGQSFTGISELYRWLEALGDLSSDVPAPDERAAYEGAIVEGVQRFQARHGLAVDGVIGKSTWATLQTPLASRVRQIELALERLRWLPHVGDDRFVVVNIPMFRLWAWDSMAPNGVPSLGMGVIVGRAFNTQTPVFVEQMRYLIFRPYWNIPPSITRHEILPAIERDPGYLERQNMEIVSGPGDDARPVAVTTTSLEQLRRGRLRVRQRPGPENSLGLVKFVFPNNENVYLHGTPASGLFSRARRDFSHGCVRVEEPIALAEWALKDQAEWTREAIVMAMNGDVSRRVNLGRPIQVILFYITAVVAPENGAVHFANDIYGHDARLDQALRRRQPGR